MIVSSRRRLWAVGLVAVLAIGGCAAGRSTAGTGTPASVPNASGGATGTPPGTFAPQPDAPRHEYYLSLGDSYAAGLQPMPSGGSRTTRVGFPYQVVEDARAKGYDYTLVNLACSGATTTSILQTPGCEHRLLGPGAPSYDTQTQADAAVQFLTAHRGEVGLITISIGGNDVIRCGAQPDPTSCLTAAVQTVGTNLGALLARLRAATGPDTRIVGTTYPDLFLGALVTGAPAARTYAKLSVLAFKSLLNPQLSRFYSAVGARFVDVTQATGGYGPLTQLTTLTPYGRIPVPVARICTLTWFCQLHDIHPRPAGHALIAGLVVGTLPAR